MIGIRLQAGRRALGVFRSVPYVSSIRYLAGPSRVRSLQQSSSTSASIDTKPVLTTQTTNESRSSLTPIQITTESSTLKTEYVLRSYPNGKPEKLIAGLQALLSPRNNRKNTWTLARDGDAIHLAIQTPSKLHLTRLIEQINKSAEELLHHPHVAHKKHESPNQHVLVVTCTTHVPHGLSLKDVKLAERVDVIIGDLGGPEVRVITDDQDGEIRELVRDLVNINEHAARKARDNHASVCWTKPEPKTGPSDN